MMENGPLIVERRDALAIVTLNEPETRNALSDAVVGALLDFVEAAKADDALGCIVLTGAGKGFCSGGNVTDMHNQAHPMFRGIPAKMQEAYRRHIQQIPLAFQTLDIPVIAAVNGAAIGAGCDLTCMCDIRIASTAAVFAESFLRVGLVPGDGGAWLLPRVVGQSRAMEMALTCDPVSAEQAREWGLVSHVVAPDELMAKAIAIAEKITAHPPVSVRLNKRLIRLSQGLDLPTSLELAASYQAIVQHTEDHREAVAALVEKRKPQYRNK